MKKGRVTIGQNIKKTSVMINSTNQVVAEGSSVAETVKKLYGKNGNNLQSKDNQSSTKEVRQD